MGKFMDVLAYSLSLGFAIILLVCFTDSIQRGYIGMMDLNRYGEFWWEYISLFFVVGIIGVNWIRVIKG